MHRTRTRFFPTGGLFLNSLLIFVISSVSWAQIQEGHKPNEIVDENPNIVIHCHGNASQALLFEKWKDIFTSTKPQVKIVFTRVTSGQEVASLANQDADLIISPESLRPADVEQLVQTLGLVPKGMVVGLDAIGVYVHQDNPLQVLTLSHLDAIFSSTRFRGASSAVESWSDYTTSKGVSIDLPIQILGESLTAPATLTFRQIVLKNGMFHDRVQWLRTSQKVMEKIASDPGAIGFCCLRDRKLGVKALALAAEGNQRAFEPTYENVLRGDYPLAKGIYLYVIFPENETEKQVYLDFLKFVLSKEGQQVVIDQGLFPVPAYLSLKQLSELEK